MGLLFRCRPRCGTAANFKASMLLRLHNCRSLELLQRVREMDQRLSPACWSFSSRRLDYDPVSVQLDQAMSVTSLMQHARRQPPPKRVRRTTTQLQKRLHKLCCSYPDGNIAVDAFCVASDISPDWLRHSDAIDVQLTVSV